MAHGDYYDGCFVVFYTHCLVPAITVVVVVGISWPWDHSWDRTGIGLGRRLLPLPRHRNTGYSWVERGGGERKERPSSLVRDVQINNGGGVSEYLRSTQTEFI